MREERQRDGGETRASGLWGTGRGGRGSEGRNVSLKRGLLALLVVALAAPLAASASGGRSQPAELPRTVAPGAGRLRRRTRTCRVIVQSDRGAGQRAARAGPVGDGSTQLDIVDAAAGSSAGRRPAAARRRLGPADHPGQAGCARRARRQGHEARTTSFRSSRPARARLRRALARGGRRRPALAPPGRLRPRRQVHGTRAPSIAFVDSGIEAGRRRFRRPRPRAART